MTTLKPWALGPFELIRHAEEHAKTGSDFDRRITLISLDNAIELSIITYLSLNPIQRSGRRFPQKDVERWLGNFHTKLEFFEYFVNSILSKTMEFERDEIIFYHQLRNELYHSGNGMVPAAAHISGIRGAALWIFSTLFNVDAESLLAHHETSSTTIPQKEDTDLSDQTKFLELFISMRHDLNMLMRIAGTNELSKTTRIPATEAWKNVFSSHLDKAPERYEQVLKQAEVLRDQIVEGKSLELSDLKLRALSHELAEVSDFIDAELRSHQREIVEKALEATSRAASPQGNRRAGIIWQTQGSGITLSAISYVTQALSIKELHNPTIIFATDMNVLVDQSHQCLITSAKSFSSLAVRVSKTSELLSILRSDQKKIVFTTVQRLLSLKGEGPFDRDNILFVGHNLHSTNEAISEVLPKAVFILFTSKFLPDDSKVVSTYGKLISKYDFRQAIEDNIAVPVDFESRHIKVSTEFDPLLEDNQDDDWFSYLVSFDYIRTLASDLVTHFEARIKDSIGKALIITPDRNISYQLFSAIISLKPEWNNQSPTEGLIKVISAETHPDEQRILLTRFEDPLDSFRLAITSGMWLTGLNSSTLKTIYLLGPMSRNYLLQAMGRLSPRCLVPECDGVVYLSLSAKETLWDNFYTAAPARLRHCVERYNIVKKA